MVFESFLLASTTEIASCFSGSTVSCLGVIGIIPAVSRETSNAANIFDEMHQLWSACAMHAMLPSFSPVERLYYNDILYRYVQANLLVVQGKVLFFKKSNFIQGFCNDIQFFVFFRTL